MMDNFFGDYLKTLNPSLLTDLLEAEGAIEPPRGRTKIPAQADRE